MVPPAGHFFTRCPCGSRMWMKPFHVAVWIGPNTCCRVAPMFLFICLKMKACLHLTVLQLDPDVNVSLIYISNILQL